MLLRFLAVLALFWLLLLPPLFTGGACTREFDEASARIAAEAAAIASPELALRYWTGRGVGYTVVTPEQCRRAKPRFLAHCGDGTLVYARVPVKNLVCRIYRDGEILVQLQYDARNRLARMQADMQPYKSLGLPGFTVHWAR